MEPSPTTSTIAWIWGRRASTHAGQNQRIESSFRMTHSYPLNLIFSPAAEQGASLVKDWDAEGGRYSAR